MKITISVTKNEKTNNYNAKFSTSIGGGQDGLKDTDTKNIAKYVEDLIKTADKAGYVGKK